MAHQSVASSKGRMFSPASAPSMAILSVRGTPTALTIAGPSTSVKRGATARMSFSKPFHLGVGVSLQAQRVRHHAAQVDQDGGIRGHLAASAQDLERFDSEDDIRLTVLDERAVPGADDHRRLDAPAALRHSVKLPQCDLQTRASGGLAQQAGGCQHTLSADPDDQDPE